MQAESNATIRARWTRRAGALALGLALLSGLPAALRAQATAPAPERARLRAHVERLASPEFEGRRGPGGEKAAAYIAEEFRRLGLHPLFADAYEQPIDGPEPGKAIGRNVGAALIGSDPDLKDEWVIVSAHFDHLGVRDGILYPGADDNASGVAMVLEVARSLAQRPEPPKRSVAFVGFDLEEDGLWGSRRFVDDPPMALDRVKLFVTADMIGRSLAGVADSSVFVMGSEHAPALRDLLAEAARGLPLRPALVGSDLLLFDRSDYGPFRARKVPYLFFSTGENPRYHTPDDTPETLDYPKLAANSLLIHRTILAAAEADALPPWTDDRGTSLDEAKAIRAVMALLLEHAEALGLKPSQETYIRNQMRTIDGVIGRGRVTPFERRRIVLGVQFVLYTVL